MPIQHNTSEITDVLFNQTVLSQVYLNNVLVFDNTSVTALLLLHSNNSNGSTAVVDSSGNNISITRVNVTHSTLQAKFGTSSLKFPGDPNSLQGDINSLGTGDFTVDFWVHPDSDGNAAGNIYFGFGNYTVDPIFLIRSNNFMTIPAGTTSPDNTIGLSVQATTWTHLSIIRYNSTINVYVNGTSAGSCVSNHDFSGTIFTVGGFTIANSSDGPAYPYKGYIDELRIIDYAAHTGNFTPPTAPY